MVDLQQTQENSTTNKQTYWVCMVASILLCSFLVLKSLQIPVASSVLLHNTENISRKIGCIGDLENNQIKQQNPFLQLVVYKQNNNISTQGNNYNSQSGPIRQSRDYSVCKRQKNSRNMQPIIYEGDRETCERVPIQNVTLLGIVVTHHKTGTVFHQQFYFDFCWHMHLNFLEIDHVPFPAIQNYNYSDWEKLVNDNAECNDYHPCNKAGIVHTRLDVRDTCTESGAVCNDWLDLPCQISACIDRIITRPNVTVINVVRNPLEMVVSAYLYHKGSPEQWANDMLLQQLGIDQEIMGVDVKGYSLSDALETVNATVGLEIVFRVLSNELFDMIFLYKLGQRYNNVNSVRFEDIMSSITDTLKHEIKLLGIEELGSFGQNLGEWIFTKSNLKFWF
eukprot:TRINITY_DN1985_c0_g1_i5.p1 TRINITY_DN1985_c0_g1~~TRINITY_DN1985_c0_g1_i5.p1  ORF type:complete len:393 (-),score=18.53 TRINITY_DN1985_c0_g1_i5:76-1254(-)